ncbi:imm68 putative immunity domain-containing protein [Sphingobacterium sp. R2]|uniref:imm68 putative immunity domain-containing protein n=1 Tax=Sphingobacterium sp. R2 TaxID=3112958 RepID=UPI00345DE8DA
MYLEKWKDTSFGTDYGNDFLEFIEEINSSPITMLDIYQQCDLKKYFDQPDLILQRRDNNVYLGNPGFDLFVHYEDAVISLSAVIVESELCGEADLTEAYGNETVSFQVSKQELETIKSSLHFIYNNPDKFVLFEMCAADEKDEVLNHLSEMLDQLQVCIDKK